MSAYAKAIYAAVLAALTAASVIYADMPVLTISLAGLTALGVLFVPAPGYQAGSWDTKPDDGSVSDPLV